MSESRRPRRPTRSSAAAATTPPASQDLDKPEEEEDAALPAEEEELESGSGAGSDEGEENDGGEGSSEETEGEGQESEQEGAGEAAASEGEESEQADEAEQEEEGEGGLAAANEDEAAATAAAGDDDEQKQQVKVNPKQQQQKPQVAAAAKSKGGRPPKGAAKPAVAKPPPAPKKDYSAVLELPPEEQHSLVVQADKIRRFRHSARAVPVCPEPKRNKTHWDHLLEEAEWMAKEFQRERAWKIKQAKRFVRAVKASKKDVESRAEVRAQEEVANIRKRASWMSKQVQGFWKKAERVVNYKVYVAIETRKRAVLDQHLDMIVGQTEAFSKMLAQNLAAPEPKQQQQQTPLALPAPQQPGASTGSKQVGRSNGSAKLDASEQQQQVQPMQGVKQGVKQDTDEEDAEETVAALAGDLMMDDEAAEAADAGTSHQQHSEQHIAAVSVATPAVASGKRRRSSSGTAPPPAAAAAAAGSAAAADQEGDAVPERPRSKRQRRSAASAAAQQPGKAAAAPKSSRAAAAAGGDVDFHSDEEASDDDEATLEEEERLAEADNEKENELDDLDAEANLPIEELLARYGFVVPDNDAEQQHHESDEEEQASDDEGAGQQQQDQGQQPSEQQQQDGQQDTAAADADEDEAVVAASRDAAAAQPTGFTLATTKVKTPVPFLLKGQLREYQHIGLDWLVSLYEKKINGILADEMGLGKTIQTVALLAYLACEEGVWGPHLVVVPTSVMLNWEMEFKKWCPAFKLLTYYGTAKERKQKRQGWSKPHAFHVCITSYTLVLQDAKMFRRKKWKYLILDEAHMIKNWKSQRWQTLLRFNSKRRLLITGTPLQNDLMELWSLMHFLMPAVFSSHAQFKDWFSNPLTGAVETGQQVSGQLVERLHGVLRPFLLRRLKSEVEKQMPAKHEHILTCRLSKRQRQLYDEYMARAETRAVMSGGNFMGVINVLMQLRKVCNHPDLFEGRPIISAYDMPQLSVQLPSLAMTIVPDVVDTAEQLSSLGLLPGQLTGKVAVWEAQDVALLAFTPTEFAAVAAEAAVDPAGYAKEASPLYRAAAEAAVQAGLVLAPEQEAAGAANGRGAYGRNGNTAAIAAVVHATDAVQQAHSQLMMTSGAAVALSSVLAQQWQKHSSWRMSRVAHAAALSLQRCGIDFPTSSSMQQQGSKDLLMTPGQLLAGGLAVSGGWLPSDACGVPVGQTSRGRFPDAGAFTSAAAARSKFLAAAHSSNSSSSSSISSRLPVCGWDLIRGLSGIAHPITACLKGRMSCRALADMPSLILEISPTYEERAAAVEELLCWFMFAIPRARAQPVDAWCCRPDSTTVRRAAVAAAAMQREFNQRGGSLRTALVRRQLFFPDRRLLQYDCGKLVELDALLRRLKAGGHRALIFTQMAKMLDVLEAFLNLHGHVYMRLDGSTKPEQRQIMMQRFNTDPKYFVFILSTRSGGVGINLTGADTVIFYDSDWNPAMDQQAQDRCHRIGQTREVHIYRLISSNTIEENILRKSDQKRQLDWLAIQSGGFNTEVLAKLNMGGGAAGGLSADDLRAALRSAEDEDDAAAAAVAEREVEAEMAEFTAEPPPEELKDDDLEAEGDEPTAMRTGTRAGTPASANTVPPPVPSSKKAQHTKKTHQNSRAAATAAAVDDSKPASPAAEGDKLEGDKAAASSGDKSTGAKGDDGGEVAAADVEPNAEDEARDLVAKDMAGLQEGQSGQDLLARLSASLSPIEQYAVRHLESLRPVDVEAAAAAAVEDIKKEEWDLDAIEKRKEQQEAEAEDSEEVIESWDKAEATAAYQAYQEQIAAVLAAEEAAAAAAAAAAEEAEMMQLTEADFAPTAGKIAGSYTYSGRPAYDDYSQQGYPEDVGGLEVTSPGRAGSSRLKREPWGWNANLPPLGGSWQQQQQLKKQKGMFDGPPAASGGYGRGGRGRGRGRGGRAASYAGGYAQQGGAKEDGGDYYYYGDDYLGEDESTNTAFAWQMLEDSGSISSQCWLKPAAEAAGGQQQQYDASGALGGSSSSLQPSLLPWEPTWDVPLVTAVAGIAASYAMTDYDAAAAADPAAAEAAAANYAVDLDSWGMFQWDHIAGQLRQQLMQPMPRTAVNQRVTGASCKVRYLQLLRDFKLLLDVAIEMDKPQPTGGCNPEQQQQQQQQGVGHQGPPAANGPSSDKQFVALPAALEQKMGGMMQQMQPAALQVLQSVIGATSAHAALVAQEWQRCQAAAGAAASTPDDGVDQSGQHVVKLSQMQQLASEIETVAQAAAEAASKAAAAATAAVAGISTRRQSEGVRQAVGGPTALVLAPTAAQMASIIEESEGTVLGAGNTVAWGAGYAAAAVMSPNLLRAASNAAVLSHRHSGSGLPPALGPVVKSEPFADTTWGSQQRQRGKQDTSAAAGTNNSLEATTNGHLASYGAQQPFDAAAAATTNGVNLAQALSPRDITGAAAAAGAHDSAADGVASGGSRGRGRSGRGRGRGRQQGRGAAADAPEQQHYNQQQHYGMFAGSAADIFQAATQPAGVAAAGAMSTPLMAAAPPQQLLLQQQQLQQLLLANQVQLQQQQMSRTTSPSPVPQQLLLQQQQQQATPMLHRASASPRPGGGGGSGSDVAAALAALQQQQQQLLAAQQQQQQQAAPTVAISSPPAAAGGFNQNQLAMLLAQQQMQQQLQAQLQQQGMMNAAGLAASQALAAASGPIPMPFVAGNGGFGPPVQLFSPNLTAGAVAAGNGGIALQAQAPAAAVSGLMGQQQGINPGLFITPKQLLQLQLQQQQQQQQLAALAAAGGQMPQQPMQQ